jgi:hypothetical protein
VSIDHDKLNKVLEGWPFKLNSGQLDFIREYISSDGHFTLIGEAGTGKSAVISVLKAYYEDEMIVCAATGVANQNLLDGKGGVGTAHRALSLPFYMNDPKAMSKVGRACTELFSNSSLIKHIIVDEFFMLNPEHLEAMLKRVTRFNKKTQNRQKRNIRIMAAGDPLQVPPVVSDRDRKYLTEVYGSHLIFNSTSWIKFNPKVRILTEVMRQNDKVFKAALNVLRYGEEHRYDGVLAWLNKRVVPNYNRNMFTVATYNKTVEQVNNRVLNANPAIKRLFEARIKGDFDLKDNNVEEEIVLCEGLECITTVNHPEGDYYNGSFCTITSVSDDGCYCHFPHNDSEIFVELHEYEQNESYVELNVKQKDGTYKDVQKQRKVGTCTQIPLLQASAFSVHRSQGRTFPKEGVLDIGWGFKDDNDFGSALLYVGLSRYTDINNIYLPRPLKRSNIKVCQESVKFYKKHLKVKEG